ncbi:MAG TPA: sigma-70 family RNA polymerase sigma factor [Streptosporangiaceae bacterium]|jgi:RNA polymerase sigma factor (sigma-70 family)
MTTASGDTVPAQEPSDAELLGRCRAGEDSEAFEGLYQRHAESAKRLARRLTRDRDRADDLVAEAFTRVLAAIHKGNGPDLAFRAYLLTVVRNVATEWAMKDKRITLVEGYDALERPTGDDDPVIARTERDFAAKAFAGLPERWQAVLWHTEVEGESPAAIAPLLGLSPNAVAALALRAREGLRQEYLRAHMSQDTPQPCRDYADRLARHARGRLGRGRRALESHLDDCARCTDLYAELVQANTGLGALIGVAVLGPLAAAYGTAETAAGTTSVSGGAGLWLARLRPRGSTGTAVAAGAAVVVVAAGAFAAVRLASADAPTHTSAAPVARNGGGQNGGNGGNGGGGTGGGNKPAKPGHHSAPNHHAAKPGGPPAPATTPQSRSSAPAPKPSAAPPSTAPTHAPPKHRAPNPPAPARTTPPHTPAPRPTHTTPAPPAVTPTRPSLPTPTITCVWQNPWCLWPGQHQPSPSLPGASPH